MSLINIKPAYMYGDDYQKDEPEKILTAEAQKLEGLDELRILENYIPSDMIGNQKKLVQEGDGNEQKQQTTSDDIV